MELIIHNFGPIKNAHICTKRYNIIIGNTSTGKSVIAKLVSIAHEYAFYVINNGDFAAFEKLLKKYGIDFSFADDTIIEVKVNLAHWKISNNSFVIVENMFDFLFENKHIALSDFAKFMKDWKKYHNSKPEELAFENNEAYVLYNQIIQNIKDNKFTDISSYSQYAIDAVYDLLRAEYAKFFPSIYIPAERNLITIFSNNIFSLLKSSANIPSSIIRFGSLYESAKSESKSLDIDFMSIRVNFSEDTDTITLKDSHADISFEQASSGMQSIIPLWTVFTFGVKKLPNATTIIEEPEQNLFPTMQVDLIYNTISQLNQTHTNIIITTHSPYILSVIDNLIFAKDVYDKATQKESREKISKMISPQTMIDYDDVAVYLCNNNGIVEQINDDEMRNTGAYALDAASGLTNRIFNELLALDNEL